MLKRCRVSKTIRDDKVGVSGLDDGLGRYGSADLKGGGPRLSLSASSDGLEELVENGGAKETKGISLYLCELFRIRVGRVSVLGDHELIELSEHGETI